MPSGSLLQRAMTIGLLGLLSGAVWSYFGPLAEFRGAAPAPSNPDAPGVIPVPPPAEVVGGEITIEQAYEHFQKGSPFVDARILEDFEKGHVEGAFWISPDQFMNGNFPAALNFIDKSATIVVYCSGGNCDASHNLVELLRTVGYNHCLVMRDGFDPWKDAGHPVSVGKPEIGG